MLDIQEWTLWDSFLKQKKNFKTRSGLSEQTRSYSVRLNAVKTSEPSFLHIPIPHWAHAAVATPAFTVQGRRMERLLPKIV